MTLVNPSLGVVNNFAIKIRLLNNMREEHLMHNAWSGHLLKLEMRQTFLIAH